MLPDYQHALQSHTVEEVKAMHRRIGAQLEVSFGQSMQLRANSSVINDLLSQLNQIGVSDVILHDDEPARRAVSQIGAHALCRGRQIFLGPTVDTPKGPSLEQTLRHELVHVAQCRMGELTGVSARRGILEDEATRLANLSHPRLDEVSGAADEFYALWWLLPLAAATYVLLRPTAANAPGEGDKTEKRVSDAQVVGEAFALFAVPSGVFTLGGRLGLGFYGSSALSGAAMTTSFRAVHDVSSSEFSGVQVYVFDAVTGAVIGVIVPGGIRLVCQNTAGLSSSSLSCR